MGTITFKAIRAAVIGGALTGAAGAFTGGQTKSLWAAAAAGAFAALIHLFQDNPLKS
jgi:pheromone shutdown protein TraB